MPLADDRFYACSLEELVNQLVWRAQNPVATANEAGARSPNRRHTSSSPLCSSAAFRWRLHVTSSSIIVWRAYPHCSSSQRTAADGQLAASRALLRRALPTQAGRHAERAVESEPRHAPTLSRVQKCHCHCCVPVDSCEKINTHKRRQSRPTKWGLRLVLVARRATRLLFGLLAAALAFLNAAAAATWRRLLIQLTCGGAACFRLSGAACNGAKL